MTPGAHWREKGEPDPHGNYYDGERAVLALGHLTDDELANAVYLYGNAPLNVDAVLRGEPSGHSYLQAAKDRIRWLSRALIRATRPNADPWRPIESAPKDGKPILLRNAAGSYVGHYCDRYQSGYRPEHAWHSLMLNHNHLPREGRYSQPTHWMPLPQSPATTS